jgi:hypothetical protein
VVVHVENWIIHAEYIADNPMKILFINKLKASVVDHYVMLNRTAKNRCGRVRNLLIEQSDGPAIQ